MTNNIESINNTEKKEHFDNILKALNELLPNKINVDTEHNSLRDVKRMVLQNKENLKSVIETKYVDYKIDLTSEKTFFDSFFEFLKNEFSDINIGEIKKIFSQEVRSILGGDNVLNTKQNEEYDEKGMKKPIYRGLERSGLNFYLSNLVGECIIDIKTAQYVVEVAKEIVNTNEINILKSFVEKFHDKIINIKKMDLLYFIENNNIENAEEFMLFTDKHDIEIFMSDIKYISKLIDRTVNIKNLVVALKDIYIEDLVTPLKILDKDIFANIVDNTSTDVLNSESYINLKKYLVLSKSNFGALPDKAQEIIKGE